MKKLTVFIFLFLLFVSCNKRWNYDRDVDFSYSIETLSWDPLDSISAEVRWIIEYKIINDLDGDTSSVTVMDIVLKERFNDGGSTLGGTNHSWRRTHKLKNYDHLEFKVTTCASSVAASWKHVKPINIGLEFFANSSCNFENDLVLMDSLFTVNSYDTTFYFNWSPPNFN
jgi:hypothetical protein